MTGDPRDPPSRLDALIAGVARVEQKVDAVQAGALRRDEKIDVLTDQVRENNSVASGGLKALNVKVDDLREAGRHRDDMAAELTERVRQNQHTNNNTAQVLTNQIAKVSLDTKANTAKLVDISSRVASLEAPVRKAMAQKAHRRQFWTKMVAVIVSVSAVTGYIIDPFYKVVVEAIAHRWLPPH